MCGIAGLIHLTDRPVPPAGVLRSMAAALVHRGPDEDGFLERPGLGLASRRLSIVGLKDGRQPLTNEDGSVHVVFNGELFDYPEQRARLQWRGHQFRTHCDTEVIPHAWEDEGEQFFEHLRGQFAFALWDQRQQTLILARDRFGICPLYWTRQVTPTGEWLLFASEIKALLASGMVKARPDLRGIHHVFTFFALPGPVTCFAGIQLLPPGHFLRIQPGAAASVTERTYWQMDFPDRGQEVWGQDEPRLLEEFDSLLRGAVARRLRADVPVVSYLSGGVDSTTVATVAAQERGRPLPTFTIRITEKKLDETDRARLAAHCFGGEPIVVEFGNTETVNVYPELIQASEGPVIDTSSGALLLLAKAVHQHGYKVALTGEGADEWLAGYPWYKVNKLVNYLDAVPGMKLSTRLRQLVALTAGSGAEDAALLPRIEDAIAGPNAWLDLYGPMGWNRTRFFTRELRAALGDHLPFDDLQINRERARRWHPLHRSLYIGARVHMAGHLLSSKGDRVAIHSAVETRYPFLDESIFKFLAKLHPRWKLRGLREKYLLRRLAQRWLPPEIAWRRKWMFRSPFDSFYMEKPPAFVGQLLSDASLRRAGYFEPDAVRHWGSVFRSWRAGSSLQRMVIEMGLVAVVATQLWHHIFIDPNLADLPSVAGSTMEIASRLNLPQSVDSP